MLKTTTNYQLFTFHKKNRKLDFKKVQKLSNAMLENNLLHLFPIVVNKEFIILDGQHRFQAAKDINAEIYYIVSESGYDIDNVADSNNFQSQWKTVDYVMYYAAGGKPEFKKLLNISTKYMITPGVIATIEGRLNPHKDIKTGDFKFNNVDEVTNVLDWAREFNKKYSFAHWNKRPFLKALRHMIRVNGFEKERLFKAIDKNRNLLIKCHEPEEYIYHLEDIYNRGNKDKIRFL